MPPDCHDLHVHTNHSKDVQDPEASFEGLAARGRELGIAVGFADHLEITYMDRPTFCFREENLPAYLEEFDRARSAFPEVTLGVELEYYPGRPDLNERAARWLELHRGELDRVLGSAHFVFDRWAVTWERDMRLALQHHTFPEILEAYMDGLDALVASGVADCLPHADAVFRGNDALMDLSPQERARADARVLELCRRASGRGMAIEVNLIGASDGTGAGPSPPWPTVEALARGGARVFVGSDSHAADQFVRAAPQVRAACGRLRALGARTP